jgi:hypothetical protein
VQCGLVAPRGHWMDDTFRYVIREIIIRHTRSEQNILKFQIRKHSNDPSTCTLMSPKIVKKLTKEVKVVLAFTTKRETHDRLDKWRLDTQKVTTNAILQCNEDD